MHSLKTIERLNALAEFNAMAEKRDMATALRLNKVRGWIVFIGAITMVAYFLLVK